MRIFVLLILLAALSGCAAWTPLHQINLGMPKGEVLQALGKPTEASGAAGEEYLWYVPLNKPWRKYYVRLENGLVESYGPVGGGSAKP